MTRAAAYLRVSTDAQVGPDKYGLDVQRADIEAYAIANGYEIVTWYTDAGVSGTEVSRPQLNACLLAAARHEFDAVIVAKLDRFSRDLLGSLWLRKEFLRSNVQVVSVAEPYDAADLSSRLFMQMVCAFAEFEKGKIAERLMRGRKAKAGNGGWPGGRAPIGYTNTPGSGVLTLDLAGAEAVQMIFALRKSGLSMEKIAYVLNFEGKKTAQGKSWNGSQVKRVLDRKTVYAGGYEFAGVHAEKGQQQAILEA